mmetsp:Transcript_17630/g.49281  ORF Transcript_17630/g.49281 Transcript_17630/m.49281 type:complete len:605 (-) Transcript_17630:383-2197(-)
MAVAKATSHEEIPPKEKHVRTLVDGCSNGASRQYLNLVLSKLMKRAHNDHGWLITLKCLITMHRLMRETDNAFLGEIVRESDRTYSPRSGTVKLENYKDVTAPDTWDYCTWIRVYSVYVDETIDLYRDTGFDIAQGQSATASKIRAMSVDKLLDLLPRLQRAQAKVVGCVPEGKAIRNGVVLESVITLAKESFLLYRALSEGIMCIVDLFFEMDRLKAQKAMDLFKNAIDGTDELTAYFQKIKGLDAISHTVTFPTLSPPPVDFLSEMEEYIKTAPIDGGDISGSASPLPPAAVTQKQQASASPAKQGNQALAHARQPWTSSALSRGSSATPGSPAVPKALRAPSAIGIAAATAGAEDLLCDLDISDPPAGEAVSKNLFGTDDFGAASSDPFSAPSAASNPFSQLPAASDPFASMSSSTFSSPAPAPAAANPFGAPAAAPANSNPFGAAAAADPFAGAADFLGGALQQQQQQQPAAMFGAPSDPFARPGQAPPAPQAPQMLFSQQPQAPRHQPIPASTFGVSPVAPPSANPFVNSGIQPTIQTANAKLSLHDPFAELGLLGTSKNQQGSKPSAPMRPSAAAMNAPKATWTAPASSAADPFGSFL